MADPNIKVKLNTKIVDIQYKSSTGKCTPKVTIVTANGGMVAQQFDHIALPTMHRRCWYPQCKILYLRLVGVSCDGILGS